MANAGRILILAKGAWEALTNYVQLDLVTRNGIAYIARRASVGVDPALDVSYTNWMPFGSAAEIATTVSPGLVMPDGTSITVTSTGLIKAVLGVEDLTDVDIENPLTNQVLRYDGTKWGAVTLGAAADKATTNAVTQGSTALVESGAVYTETSALSESVQTLTNSKVNVSDIANNLTTTTEGKVLDARQGKALGDLNTVVSITADRGYSNTIAVNVQKWGKLVVVSGWILLDADTYTDTKPVLIVPNVRPLVASYGLAISTAGDKTVRLYPLDRNSRTEMTLDGSPTLSEQLRFFFNMTYVCQ